MLALLRARHTSFASTFFRLVIGLAITILFAYTNFSPALAAAALTITPITWNVIGLDSNKVTVGPNTYPVGARVCNTGDATATNVVATLNWDTTNTFIDLVAGSPSTLSVSSLA